MVNKVVISDSSALIGLEQIGQLTLLKDLFTEVIIPPQVAIEVAPTVVLPNWVKVQSFIIATLQANFD
jgi:predicted nucleic acid-binding protein